MHTYTLPTQYPSRRLEHTRLKARDTHEPAKRSRYTHLVLRVEVVAVAQWLQLCAVADVLRDDRLACMQVGAVGALGVAVAIGCEWLPEL